MHLDDQNEFAYFASYDFLIACTDFSESFALFYNYKIKKTNYLLEILHLEL